MIIEHLILYIGAILWDLNLCPTFTMVFVNKSNQFIF